MDKTLLEENKKKLLAEEKRLKTVLGHETVPDSEFPGGHKPTFTELGNEGGENASESEQFGNELSVSEDLEARLVKVQAALSRIESGAYGKCSVDGGEIDGARMRAEPAADTCVKHAK